MRTDRVQLEKPLLAHAVICGLESWRSHLLGQKSSLHDLDYPRIETAVIWRSVGKDAAVSKKHRAKKSPKKGEAVAIYDGGNRPHTTSTPERTDTPLVGCALSASSG